MHMLYDSYDNSISPFFLPQTESLLKDLNLHTLNEFEGVLEIDGISHSVFLKRDIEEFPQEDTGEILRCYVGKVQIEPIS